LQRLVALDHRLSLRLAIPSEARLLHAIALVLAHTGDSPLWLLATAITLIWGNAAWQGFGGRILVGILATGAATTILKWVFRRRRPPGESKGFYSRFDRHAFPSGHSGRCACVALLLSPLLPTWGWVPTALWVGLVGLTRVALQVHFISDVLGGWLAGVMVGAALQVALFSPA
jgi:undecaprenyl-diphosphatase